MARIRTIKPDFFRHERLYDAEREMGLPLRLAFAGLWTAADREGRFRWAPRQLKLDCLPYDDVDFSRVLDALATRGFIVKYQVEGVLYGHIPSWHQHQVINNREKPSDLPEHNENNTLTREARDDDASPTPLCNYQVEGEGKGKGREGEKEDAPNGALSKYAFERGVIKLNRKDLDQWNKVFTFLDVPAELEGMTEWAGNQRDWFLAVKGLLTKRNRAAAERAKAPQPPEQEYSPII